MFVFVLLCITLYPFWFCNHLKRKRKLLLSYRCIVILNVMWLFPTVPWVGLQYVIVVFPDHTHLLLLNRNGGVIHFAEKAGEKITFYQATKTWINMRFFRHINMPTVALSRILNVHYPVALDVCIYTQSINTEGIKFSSFSSYIYSFPSYFLPSRRWNLQQSFI